MTHPLGAVSIDSNKATAAEDSPRAEKVGIAQAPAAKATTGRRLNIVPVFPKGRRG